MQAWHFLSRDKRLGYDDGRRVEVGVPLECEGEMELCENGMHGSVRLIDALYHAKRPIVCRVEIEGDVIEGQDKICGRRRTVLWWIDATQILHEFACWCAEDALTLIDNPDPRSVAAIDAKRRWLAGEISEYELAAARADAWAPARAAADAARWAAEAAARDAAWAAWAAADATCAAWAGADTAACAAWDAAYAAACAAARAAADADAYAAAIAKYNARLTAMVMKAHEDDEE